MMSIKSAVVVLLCGLMMVGVWGQDDLPVCDVGTAQDCFTNGVNSQTPSGCNWYIIMPILSQCVDDSVAGCTYVEQENWYSSIKGLNDSFKADGCYPSCTNHADRENRTLGCFDMLGFSGVALRISQDPSIGPTSTDCGTLRVINSCVTNATAGCTGLTDYAYNRINSTQGGKAAFGRCGMTVFQPSTTSAPLDVNKSMPPATPDPDTFSTTKSNKLEGGEILAIILGILLLLVVLLIIAILIFYCVRKSRQAKDRSILRDWRPNGQHVYRDEPHIIRHERIDFRGANEGGRVYKPSQLNRSVEERQPREVFVNQGLEERIPRDVYVNRGLVLQ